MRQACTCGNRPSKPPYGAFACEQCGTVWVVARKIEKAYPPEATPTSETWMLHDPIRVKEDE